MDVILIKQIVPFYGSILSIISAFICYDLTI